MEETKEETKEEKRKRQMKEAQKRYLAKHKKEKGTPASYEPDKIKDYHKSYYQVNKDKIIERAKKQYEMKKKLKAESDTNLKSEIAS